MFLRCIFPTFFNMAQVFNFSCRSRFYCGKFHPILLPWIVFWGNFYTIKSHFNSIATFNPNSFAFVFYRNRFLLGNLLKLSISNRRKNKKCLIDVVKLVASQHSYLTGILDQLLGCYSLQVKLLIFPFFQNAHRSIYQWMFIF